MITQRERYLMREWADVSRLVPSKTLDDWLEVEVMDSTVGQRLSDEADVASKAKLEEMEKKSYSDYRAQMAAEGKLI